MGVTTRTRIGTPTPSSITVASSLRATGASLTARTLIVAVAASMLNAVFPPLVVVSTPMVPLGWPSAASHPLNIKVALP